MINLLRDRMRTQLSMHNVGVLTVSAHPGTWAMPVRYRVRDLEVDCLVPRWADITYHLGRGSDVLLVVMAEYPYSSDTPLYWLQYKGQASLLVRPDLTGLLPSVTPTALAGDLYQVIRIVPERIDLMDERQGWGARETLEIDTR